MSTAGLPQRIGWKALHEQFGQGFSRERDFRRDFLKVLSLVHAQYRAARIVADEGGLELRTSPPPVSGRLGPVPKALK
jgi:hypothetical protein